MESSGTALVWLKQKVSNCGSEISCNFRKKSALNCMFCCDVLDLEHVENGELSSHLTAPINSSYWAYEQSLPVNPKCRKGVFSILWVTGSVGHLRTVLTKMALISLSTARPIHPNAFMMRSAGARQRDWAVVWWQLSFYTPSLNLMCGSECTF